MRSWRQVRHPHTNTLIGYERIINGERITYVF